MKVLEDKKNSALNRKEVKIIIESEKNPGLVKALEVVESQFKADKELIIIKKVQGKFGRNTFLIEAFIYDSKEDKEKIEPKSKKQREQEEKSINQRKQTERVEIQEKAEQSEESKEKINDNKKEKEKQEAKE